MQVQKKIFKKQVQQQRLQNLFWSKNPNVKLTHTVFFVGPQSFSLSRSFTLTLSHTHTHSRALSLSLYLSSPTRHNFPSWSLGFPHLSSPPLIEVSIGTVFFFTAEATELTDPPSTMKTILGKKMENRDPPTATHRD